MRIHLTVSLLLGVVLSAPALYAQEVKTTKASTRGLWDKVSSQSANVQARHLVMRNSNTTEGREDELKKTYVATGVRGNFFLGLFNDKMMNQLILQASQVNDGNAMIKQRRPQLFSTVTAVDTPYFTFTPYTNIYFPYDGKGTNGAVGIIPQGQIKDINTFFGKLSLATRIEAEAQVSSREEDIKVVNADEINANKKRKKQAAGLVASEPGKQPDSLDNAKSDPTYEAIYVGEANLNLEKWAKGLSFLTYFEYVNDYTPAYNLDEDGTRNKVWMIDRYVFTWYQVSYAVNEALTVSNLIGTNHDGFYQAKSSHEVLYGRFTNLAMLTYKIY